MRSFLFCSTRYDKRFEFTEGTVNIKTYPPVRYIQIDICINTCEQESTSESDSTRPN